MSSATALTGQLLLKPLAATFSAAPAKSDSPSRPAARAIEDPRNHCATPCSASARATVASSSLPPGRMVDRASGAASLDDLVYADARQPRLAHEIERGADDPGLGLGGFHTGNLYRPVYMEPSMAGRSGSQPTRIARCGGVTLKRRQRSREARAGARSEPRMPDLRSTASNIFRSGRLPRRAETRSVVRAAFSV